jgi:glutamine cyclotransferase
MRAAVLAEVAALLVLACGGRAPEAAAVAAAVPPEQIRYRVAAVYPHDPRAFTQGLLVHGGRLLESTGQYGHSELREVEIETGRVLRSASAPAAEFGEGLTLARGSLFQLTWQNGIAHVLDPATFARIADHRFEGEGWGLTFDGKELVQSDGSARLIFRSPATFAVTRTIDVRRAGAPQFYLNELEWIDGAIWANVWMSDELVRVDPATGAVTGVLAAAGLLSPEEAEAANVLNGIAWDAAKKRLYVTGKYWPKLFELELSPADKGGGSKALPGEKPK